MTLVAFASPISSGTEDRFAVRNTVHALGSSAPYARPAVIEDEFTEYELYNFGDWDGAGALPIAPETVRSARQFKFLFNEEVPPPDIAAGADGTIGFQWRYATASGTRFILIDVGPGNRIYARAIDCDGKITPFSLTTVNTGASALLTELFSS